MNGWIGVDLDGTLAQYDGWVAPDHIGEPVPVMLARVKNWLDDGKDVRILTARVSTDGTVRRDREAAQALIAIQDWCVKHLEQRLRVTCRKDYAMVELWDDRAVQVKLNTGEPVGFSTRGN